MHTGTHHGFENLIQQHKIMSGHMVTEWNRTAPCANSYHSAAFFFFFKLIPGCFSSIFPHATQPQDPEPSKGRDSIIYILCL